jgi:hypothetical protein
MSDISLTFPDGSARSFKSGVTGRESPNRSRSRSPRRRSQVPARRQDSRPRRADQIRRQDPHPDTR